MIERKELEIQRGSLANRHLVQKNKNKKIKKNDKSHGS
jgi:hypothetical protein